MSKDRSVADLQKSLENRRDSLIAQLKQVEQAISGLNLAQNLAGTNGHPIVASRASRSGEHKASPEIMKSIESFMVGVSGQFGMKAIRDFVAKEDGLSGDKLRHPVALAMRELEAKKIIDVVVRGVGRREAIYEKHKRG